MKRQELFETIYRFVTELPVKDTEEIRLTFLEVMEKIRKERNLKSDQDLIEKLPAEGTAKDPQSSPEPPPPVDGSIKDLFFSQLKQVASQIKSAGKQAISQVGGIKKDFTEKVKLTEGSRESHQEDKDRDSEKTSRE